MSSLEYAGEALFQLHEGNRGLAAALADVLRRRFGIDLTAASAGPTSLSGASFAEQEPGLAAEQRFATRL